MVDTTPSITIYVSTIWVHAVSLLYFNTDFFFSHNMYLIQHNRRRSIYYCLNTLENFVPQYIAGILVEVMLQLRRYVGYQEILEFYLINRVHILGFSLHILWAVFPEREDSHCLTPRNVWLVVVRFDRSLTQILLCSSARNVWKSNLEVAGRH